MVSGPVGEHNLMAEGTVEQSYSTSDAKKQRKREGKRPGKLSFKGMTPLPAYFL
jgi:hypothetical protein